MYAIYAYIGVVLGVNGAAVLWQSHGLSGVAPPQQRSQGVTEVVFSLRIGGRDCKKPCAPQPRGHDM